MLRFSPIAAVAIAALVACRPPPLEAEDYEQSCERNSDCAAVMVGDQCPDVVCHRAEWAAINVGDIERFQADDLATREACPNGLEAVLAPPSCDGPFGPLLPTCASGQCVIEDDAEVCPWTPGPCIGID